MNKQKLFKLALEELRRNGGPMRFVQLLHVIKSRFGYDMLGPFDVHRVILHKLLMENPGVINFGVPNKKRFFQVNGEENV